MQCRTVEYFYMRLPDILLANPEAPLILLAADWLHAQEFRQGRLWLLASVLTRFLLCMLIHIMLMLYF